MTTREIVEQYLAAIESRDLDRVASLVHDDVMVVEHPNKLSPQGKRYALVAMRVIQVPTRETLCPPKNRRKFRDASARVRRGRSRSAADVTAVTSAARSGEDVSTADGGSRTDAGRCRSGAACRSSVR